MHTPLLPHRRIRSAALGLLIACSVVSPQASAAHAPAPPSPRAGGWIVYEGPIPGGAGIRLVRSDGSDDHWATPQVPLPDGGWQVHPDWSPDGSMIAFAADDADGSGTRDLWVARADGSQARRVYDCLSPCSQADAPAWSPDGRTLAFAGYDLVNGNVLAGTLSLLDLRTGRVRVVATAGDALHDFMWPRWSPDGTRVVLELQRWSDTTLAANLVMTNLAVVDLRRTKPVVAPITGAGDWASYPDWHPSKDLIVFFSQPAEAGASLPSNLYTIRPNGSGLTRITSYALGDRRPVQPSWTPDGHRIIFALASTTFDDWQMMTVHADGGGLLPATSSGPVFGTHPRLQPTR